MHKEMIMESSMADDNNNHHQNTYSGRKGRKDCVRSHVLQSRTVTDLGDAYALFTNIQPILLHLYNKFNLLILKLA